MPKHPTAQSISVRPPTNMGPFCPTQTSWLWVSARACRSCSSSVSVFIARSSSTRELDLKIRCGNCLWASDFVASHLETADWCVKRESCCWCWHMPTKRRGARGRRAVYELYSFIQASGSPCGATSPVPCHLYANKFPLNPTLISGP